MSETPMNEARQEALFMSLVAMLSHQSMMALGKIVPPGQEEPMIDVEVARAMIDTLDMLHKKTDSSRTSEETRYLELQLTNLRLNFLEVQKEQGQSDSSSESEESKE